MNVSVLAEQDLARHGSYVRLRFEGRGWTNASLLDAAAVLGGALRVAGVTPGDRVVVMAPNRPEIPITFGGVFRVGGVVVPLLFLLSDTEIAHIIADAEPKVAITSPEFLPKIVAATSRLASPPTIVVLDELPTGAPPGTVTWQAFLEGASPEPILERSPDDLAVLSYTGGTTGTPKGVMLSHGNCLFNARASAAAVDVRDGDVSLQTLPLSHSFGIGAMLTGQLFRATGILLRWFTSDAFFEAVGTHRACHGSVVPTMLSFLLADPRFDDVDWSSMRWLVVGGAACPQELAEEFQRRSGVRILPGYGLTETSPTISVMRPSDPLRPRSSGRPVEGVAVRVVDPATGSVIGANETGEITCRGPNVMLGYRNMPEATAAVLSEDGWFSTGDLGHLDAEGFLYVTDRKKDLIIRAGFNIVPGEVEEVLYQHPAVAQAAVVGGRHPVMGEEVVAFVVARTGVTVSEDELIAHCQGSLAKYKTPRVVRFVDALPMSGMAKILRRELRDQASALVAARDLPA